MSISGVMASTALEDAFTKSGLIDNYDLLAPRGHVGQRIICVGAVKKEVLAGVPQWLEDFPPKFNLRSKGDDIQTADISVQISKFSRPVLHLKL